MLIIARALLFAENEWDRFQIWSTFETEANYVSVGVWVLRSRRGLWVVFVFVFCFLFFRMTRSRPLNFVTNYIFLTLKVSITYHLDYISLQNIFVLGVKYDGNTSMCTTSYFWTHYGSWILTSKIKTWRKSYSNFPSPKSLVFFFFFFEKAKSLVFERK